MTAEVYIVSTDTPFYSDGLIYTEWPMFATNGHWSSGFGTLHTATYIHHPFFCGGRSLERHRHFNGGGRAPAIRTTLWWVVFAIRNNLTPAAVFDIRRGRAARSTEPQAHVIRSRTTTPMRTVIHFLRWWSIRASGYGRLEMIFLLFDIIGSDAADAQL